MKDETSKRNGKKLGNLEGTDSGQKKKQRPINGGAEETPKKGGVEAGHSECLRKRTVAPRTVEPEVMLLYL